MLRTIGANWNKGFEYYLLLDEYIGKNWKGKIDFTYIGNVPQNVYFENSTVISPISGIELANKIKKNHIYITGSINEPSGNHHIEASQCGLPLMYINSGGLPEYCNGYGVMFNNSKDFEEKLVKIIVNYDFFYKKMESYPFDSQIMSKDYLDLFEKMIQNKEKYLKERRSRTKSSYIGSKIFEIKRKKN